MLTFRGRGGGKSFHARKTGNNAMSVDRARALRLPHIGAKEQERAKRCEMLRYYSWEHRTPVKRAAPIMFQRRK